LAPNDWRVAGGGSAVHYSSEARVAAPPPCVNNVRYTPATTQVKPRVWAPRLHKCLGGLQMCPMLRLLMSGTIATMRESRQVVPEELVQARAHDCGFL
jgi:hypothetical protein